MLWTSRSPGTGGYGDNSNGKFALLLAVLLGVGGLMRLMLPVARPLAEIDPQLGFSDEIHEYYARLLSSSAWTAGSLNYREILRGTKAQPNITCHPPGYYYISAALGGAGDGRAGLKVLTFLCNAVTLLLVYLILRRIYGQDMVPVLFGLNAVLFLPSHIAIANFASNDILMPPASALFLLLTLERHVWDGGLRRVLAYGALCGFMLLAKFTAVACALYFCAQLLIGAAWKRVSGEKALCYALSFGLVCAAISGWYYHINYEIYGDPFYFPGRSLLREHSFLSFRFADLLRSPEFNWNTSDSVLTGLYSSFFTFPWINGRGVPQFFRNAVLCSGLLVSLPAVLGLASPVGFRRVWKPLLLLAITDAAVVWLLWRFDVSQGLLKSNYLMFLVPVYAVCQAEGLLQLRASWPQLLRPAVLAALCFDVSVAAYYICWMLC